MARQSPSLWYLWAALIGVVAALAVLLWIAIGVDPFVAALGMPRWVGHGMVTLALVVVIGWAVQQVRSPH